MRRWIAVQAVWLLLMQAMLGGFVAARAAAAPALPMCAAGTAGAPSNLPGRGHDMADLPACCSVGCNAAAMAAPPPADATLVAQGASLCGKPVVVRDSVRKVAHSTAHPVRGPPL